MNILNITSLEIALIDSITGLHQPGKTDEDDIYFDVIGNIVHYFPKGLEKLFKNIRGISIIACGLKEVNQNDLKFYPQLEYLDLSENNIEKLNNGLFDFNPQLEVICFDLNKIFRIETMVFESLTKLHTLDLSENTCIDEFTDFNTDKVRKITETAKKRCILEENNLLEVSEEYKKSGGNNTEKIKEQRAKTAESNKTGVKPIYFGKTSLLRRKFVKKQKQNF